MPLLLAILFHLPLAASLIAQAPSPAPSTPAASATDTAEPDLAKLRAQAETQAHLRVWSLLPAGGGVFDVAEIGGRVLAAGVQPGQCLEVYQELPPRPSRLTAYPPGDRNSPASNPVNATLARNTYSTVILAPGADPAHPKMFLVDDTYDFESTPAGQLFIWQGVSGGFSTVTVGSEKLDQIPANEARIVKEIPLSKASTPISVQTVKADGKLVDYQLAVTFNDARRAALLILPDRFNRVRPFVLRSGEIVPPAARRSESRR